MGFVAGGSSSVVGGTNESSGCVPMGRCGGRNKAVVVVGSGVELCG